MNDLLYYQPIADILEADATWQDASTQVRFGYLTLVSSFHWYLQKFIGNVSPTYRIAPATKNPMVPDIPLPYLNDKQSFYVNIPGMPCDDWPTNATVVSLGNVHADAMASMLHAGSADVAATLLSNIGHTVVIRVVLAALRQARRRTIDPGVLEEAISTLCLLSHRRYEGRRPEIAICFGPAPRRALRKHGAMHFGRDFLTSKTTAVLFKGSSHIVRCLRNGRVIEIIDLRSSPPSRPPVQVVAPRSQLETLAYSFSQGGLTTALTSTGEVQVSMGARILFSWDAATWRLYPGRTLATRLLEELRLLSSGFSELHWNGLANHLTTTALTLREEGLGALFVVATSEDAIKTLTKGKRYNQSPVESLYSQLFQGRDLLSISPQLLCNAAGLDGAVVIDTAGTVRGIGCIFSAIGQRTPAEGARTKAALFGSKYGIALKLSQDGEIGLHSRSESIYAAFSWIG